MNAIQPLALGMCSVLRGMCGLLCLGASPLLQAAAPAESSTPPPDVAAPAPEMIEKARAQAGANWLEAMRERLELSAEQEAQLKPVFEQESAKVRALKADSALTDEQMREKSLESMGRVREKLAAVLTPEQKAKAAEALRQRGEGFSQDKVEARLKALREKLALTDTQVDKLRTVLAEEGPKMKASRDNSTSSPEERREAMRQSFERIAAELSPEQREKMREQRAQPKN